jgi:transcriptional regulator with XRE-family HTH domain
MTGVEMKLARTLFEIRQRDLARESGLHEYTLSRFESGSHKPSSQELRRILAAFLRLIERRIAQEASDARR